MGKLSLNKTICIETNTTCQLRCPTCPTTSNGYPPVIGAGYLHFSDFKELIEKNPWVRTIRIINLGEMFLNPDLGSIIEYATKRKIKMYCEGGVNLNTAKPDVLEIMVEGKYFKTLYCSIDGASSETYSLYRKGGDFNTVIGNIKTINRLKKKYHSPYPKLFWQFVVFGHNEHELPVARALAKALNMEFVPKLSWDSKYSPIKNYDFVKANTGWKHVTREEFEKENRKNYVRATCYMLFDNPRINWDGKILGCCWNNWGEFGSNAFIEGYDKAINHQNIIYAQGMLLGKFKKRDDIPCSQCDLYNSMLKTGNFLTIKEIHRQHKLWYRTIRMIYHLIPRSFGSALLSLFKIKK